MSDSRERLAAIIIVGLLSLVVVGGAIGGWLLGKDPPGWLLILVGAVGTAAFPATAFFGQARQTGQILAALAESRQMHHELAMVAATLKQTTTNGEPSAPSSD